ncbi:MAG: NnrU family protein [Burkholderiales bacterium]|nr:NnrU family protein [Burkholderiales bacterium]
MSILIVGLIVFLGAHSVRIVAEDWRARRLRQMGIGPWKGLYSLVSIIGFVLIVWGYAMTRAVPVDIWHPPLWTRHVAALLTVPAFILLAAAYVPHNRIKAAVGHPMILGVKLWAFAHLLANGRLGDIVLFGAFLIWAILDYRAARQRDRANGAQRAPGRISGDVVTVVAGLAVWAAFALVLHAWLIGVRPLG